MSKREEERGITHIKDSVDASIQRHEDYIEKCGGRLITSPETILKHEEQENGNNQKIKDGKKNNSMDVLID